MNSLKNIAVNRLVIAIATAVATAVGTAHDRPIRPSTAQSVLGRCDREHSSAQAQACSAVFSANRAEKKLPLVRMSTTSQSMSVRGPKEGGFNPLLWAGQGNIQTQASGGGGAHPWQLQSQMRVSSDCGRFHD